MAQIQSTLWTLEAHTRAKHDILQRYLQAWIPILTLGGFDHILYIDGFAGPGRYSGGEAGSPVIALRAALEHQSSISSTVSFYFVEYDVARADTLARIISEIAVPDHFTCEVIPGETFEAAYRRIADSMVQQYGKLPPTLAFVDPFGWAGVPFAIIQEILGFPNCEVLVTFMYEEINRFINHPQQEENFDAFFGTIDWRSISRAQNPAERNAILHDLYDRQLRSHAGAKYVRSFQMRNDRDVVDYYLFFATNNLSGLKRMKEAMWRVDASGEFQFSDATNPNQLMLLSKNPDSDHLKQLIVQRFSATPPTIAEIEEFILSSTPFRETHYKRQVLRAMELATPPELEVLNAPPGRKRGTYGDPKLRVRFLRRAGDNQPSLF